MLQLQRALCAWDVGTPDTSSRCKDDVGGVSSLGHGRSIKTRKTSPVYDGRASGERTNDISAPDAIACVMQSCANDAPGRPFALGARSAGSRMQEPGCHAHAVTGICAATRVERTLSGFCLEACSSGSTVPTYRPSPPAPPASRGSPLRARCTASYRRRLRGEKRGDCQAVVRVS